jgi:hypothetical protein
MSASAATVGRHGRGGACARCGLPTEVRGLRGRGMALLRRVPPRPRTAGASVVLAVWSARRRSGLELRRLPAGAAHERPRPLPLRRSGKSCDPSLEVLRMAGCRDRPGRRHHRHRPTARRRGHLGTARPSPARGARLRPSSGPGQRGRPPAGCAVGPAPPPRRPHGSPSSAARGGATASDARGVRAAPPRAASRPARRRRAHDRRHRGGLRREPARSRSP